MNASNQQLLGPNHPQFQQQQHALLEHQLKCEQAAQQAHHANQRHSDPLGGMSKDKMPNFSDLAKTTPPFKDYLNNLQTYAYMQQLEQTQEGLQPRHHTQITQQYSSSTDEGNDTDHGGKKSLYCFAAFCKSLN